MGVATGAGFECSGSHGGTVRRCAFTRFLLSSCVADGLESILCDRQDGVDIAFFNSRERCTSTSSEEILEVFRRVQPKYKTPTADAVRRILEPYMQVGRFRALRRGFFLRRSSLFYCLREHLHLTWFVAPQTLEEWQRSGKERGKPRPKPLNLVILTGSSSRLLHVASLLSSAFPADGAPDDDQNPEMVLVETARRLDAGRFPPFQVGCSFVQIGN